VLNLLVELKREFNLTYLFVAHNLAVVGYISDRIAVMYLGKIVELGPARELFANPQHPYTMALLSAIPQPVPGQTGDRIILSGDVPSPINPPSGCRFRTRCPIAKAICAEQEPPMEMKPEGPPGSLPLRWNPDPTHVKNQDVAGKPGSARLSGSRIQNAHQRHKSSKGRKGTGEEPRGSSPAC